MLVPLLDKVKKDREKIEEQNLRLDCLAVTVEDHRVKINALLNRVASLGGKGGMHADITIVKADIVNLKKEVVVLKSTDITSLWGFIEVPLEVGTSVILVIGTDSEFIPYSSEINEEALRVDIILEEHGDLCTTEEAIVAAITRESLQGRSIIWMSALSDTVEPEHVMLQIGALESTILTLMSDPTPQDLGMNVATTSSSVAPPPHAE